MVSGAQSVMTPGTYMMLLLFAGNLGLPVVPYEPGDMPTLVVVQGRSGWTMLVVPATRQIWTSATFEDGEFMIAATMKMLELPVPLVISMKIAGHDQ